MPLWHRLIVFGVVLLITLVIARLIDRRIARRQLTPEAMTRYRILRRSVTATIVAVGVLSALLVIPQVRAVAGGLLASTAVLGIIVGFASQRTLGNFVAGLRSLREGAEVFISDLAGNATIVVRARAEDEPAAERLEQALRLEAYDVLRGEGVYA